VTMSEVPEPQGDIPHLLTCRDGHTGAATVFITIEGDRQRIVQGQLDPVGCEACWDMLRLDTSDDVEVIGIKALRTEGGPRGCGGCPGAGRFDARRTGRGPC
jgi:hypothetical protein